jgi:hypothetical protein
MTGRDCRNARLADENRHRLILSAFSIGAFAASIRASSGVAYPQRLAALVNRMGIGIVADYVTLIACGR